MGLIGYLYEEFCWDCFSRQERHRDHFLVVLLAFVFVCVEVLRPSQPSGVMSSAVSLPNHTITGQALSSKRLTSIVHIPLPETVNCPS